jgi:hypothetical protein
MAQMATMASDAKVNKVFVVHVEGVGWPREIGVIVWNVETKERVERSVDIPKHLRQVFVTPLKERKVAPYNVDEARAIQRKLLELRVMAVECDAVMAHNATFDRKMLSGIEELSVLGSKRWLCSMHEFPWPDGLKLKLTRHESLATICKAMDVDVSHEHERAHQGLALADCQLLIECMEKLEDLRPRLVQMVYYNWYQTKFGKRRAPSQWSPSLLRSNNNLSVRETGTASRSQNNLSVRDTGTGRMHME